MLGTLVVSGNAFDVVPIAMQNRGNKHLELNDLLIFLALLPSVANFTYYFSRLALQRQLSQVLHWRDICQHLVKFLRFPHIFEVRGLVSK